MSKIAVESVFGSLPSYQYGSSSYTSSALGVGSLMVQINGGSSTTNWAGPCPIGIIRPFEYTTSIPATFPWAMQWSNTVDWVFLADNAAAAVNRRVVMATLDRTNGNFNINGFVNVLFPANTTAHTVRAFRMTYDLHTTGSVSVLSGSNVVTGVGTTFSQSCACVGNRIGFGSSDPTQISTWYEVTGSITNTQLNLTTPSATTYASGSPYVIEDLRAVIITTNATATNGGVFVTKGLRKEIFTSGAGTTLNAATGSDNIRATYWLADGLVLSNTASFGAGIEPESSFTNQNLYVLDTVANPMLFKYNIRKPLILASGKDTSSFVLRTGPGGVPSGTISQVNNGRLATLGHGPGSGSSCLYFTTTTKIYRTVPVSTITTGSVSWIADLASENPPGGTATFAASSLLNSVEYAGLLDKLIISVNSTTTPFRSYITQYRTDNGQFDRVFGTDTRQIDQSTADLNDTTLIPSMCGAPFTVWSEGGMAYIATLGTTAITNRVYSIPLAADWEYASSTDSRLVTPEILTPNASKYVRLYVNSIGNLGGSTGQNLGLSTEDYRCYYRTTGINNDSGTWTLLDKSGDLSGVSGASSIQFMFEFRVIGLSCVPDRILSCTVLYQDNTTDSHYQPSVAFSDISNKYFAWRFSTAWGSTVPTLAINLYDAVSGGLLVTDNTSSPTGTWWKSTDNGNNWGSYNTTDLGNTGSYIRYQPASLGDNIKVKAILTQQ